MTSRRHALASTLALVAACAPADAPPPTPVPQTAPPAPPETAATPTTTAPVTTTAAPVPPVPRAPASTAPAPVVPPAGGGGDVWAALAACESGGRADIRNPPYSGAFQFTAATWRSMGETGQAADYSYEYQRAVAERLQARSGWSQWPACSRKLGLR